MIRHLKAYFGLAGADLVAGGRYHNLHDLHSFPRGDRADLAAAPLPPLPHPGLESAGSIFEAVARRERILHFPYQSYDYVLRFLREARSEEQTSELQSRQYLG